MICGRDRPRCVINIRVKERLHLLEPDQEHRVPDRLDRAADQEPAAASRLCGRTTAMTYDPSLVYPFTIGLRMLTAMAVFGSGANGTSINSTFDGR
jgi:hypothetical protein